MKQELYSIDSLIVRYLDGEATHEEMVKLDMWVNFSKDNERYFIKMVKIWEQSHMLRYDENYVEQRFSEFKRLLFRRKVRRMSYGIASAAAVILLILIIRFFIPASTEPLLSESTIDQKKELILPDGSIVWLNKNTHIRYTKDFVSRRNVYLDGEAYFDVVENKDVPFVVETADLVINVLGTQFVVTDYGNESVAETVLESGSIKLITQKNGESFQLQPGQLVSYDKAVGEVHLKNVDTRNFTDWINNRLIFDNTPLKDAFIRLEKWYGIRIICDDKTILQTPVSFTVDNESKEKIFNTLKEVVPFTWVLEPNSGDNNPTITILSVNHTHD